MTMPRAFANIKGLQPVSAEQLAAIEKFRKTMREEIIPQAEARILERERNAVDARKLVLT